MSVQNWVRLGIVVGAMGLVSVAQAKPLTVVELFTSQGCSSCPPANANLIKLGQRADVLALSFAVTYWDQLGWKDIFGHADYTKRQVTYEAPLGESGAFTPQMVINGRVSLVGNDFAEVANLVAQAAPLKGPNVSLEGGKVQVSTGAAPQGGADVWFVRYDPRLVEVPVARGENAGRTLPHSHVVHGLTRLGDWQGPAASFALPSPQDGLKTAILVQGRSGGPILAAVSE